MSGLLAMEHKSLEHTVDILAKLLRHMIGSKIVGINCVRYQLIPYSGTVKQTRCIGLGYFVF